MIDIIENLRFLVKFWHTFDIWRVIFDNLGWWALRQTEFFLTFSKLVFGCLRKCLALFKDLKGELLVVFFQLLRLIFDTQNLSKILTITIVILANSGAKHVSASKVTILGNCMLKKIFFWIFSCSPSEICHFWQFAGSNSYTFC